MLLRFVEIAAFTFEKLLFTPPLPPSPSRSCWVLLLLLLFLCARPVSDDYMLMRDVTPPLECPSLRAPETALF